MRYSGSVPQRAFCLSSAWKSGRYGLLCTLSLILVLACSFPSAPPQSGLIINISASGARALVPNIDMNAASYVVSGNGPSGATFSATITSGTSTTVSSLASGSWAVAVDGKNAAGTFVVHGDATAQVATGTASTLNVTVLPIAGPGSLSLKVNWPASVVAPSIKAQLVAAGSSTNLVFPTPPGSVTSSYDGSGIMNGYYTLIIQLYDSTTLVAGAVDVAQIVQGQTTSGTYTFTSVNTKGSIAVNITPNLLNPIAVTLSGQQATVGTGTAVTLSASVPAGIGNVTCAWYVNGIAMAVGASYTLNGSANALPLGTYRIDVTAFTSDGLRAGSASTTMSVVTVGSVDLAWDPNTEATLAGYKLYIGTVSGVYGAPVTLGLVTTTTVPNLVRGTTYYFALTAFDSSGQESEKSAELVYKAI